MEEGHKNSVFITNHKNNIMTKKDILDKFETECKGVFFNISHAQNGICGLIEGTFKAVHADFTKDISEEPVLRFHFENAKGDKVVYGVRRGYSLDHDVDAVFRDTFMIKGWSSQTYFRVVN